ncbi:MAG TPA: hypothetical protein PKA82_12195 [Pyrinomonadaceae bacterium]|nr:hypothetical protein [Pyrinomonadaceae bacterium]
MKTKLFALTLLSVFAVAAVAFVGGDVVKGDSTKRASNELVALLPDSDVVATGNVKQFFGDALPRVMAANQPMLDKVMGHLNVMTEKTGIDIRKFDSVAVGAKLKGNDLSKMDIDAVAIVRGDVSTAALLGLAKLAGKGTYREEKIGERTVYIFKAGDVVDKTVTAKAAKTGMADHLARELTQEMAVTAYDGGTLVVGSVDMVRATLSHTTAVSTTLTSMLSNREASVFTFAGRMPENVASTFGLDADGLSKNIDSIRYMSGSMDVGAFGMNVSITARTATTAQANSFGKLLSDMRFAGKAIFSGAKRPDQQLYGRLIENAKITLRDNDVSLDLTVPQADVDKLVAMIK